MKQKAEPKQRLLDAATELFFKQGYHATGINQVIEEAGVAKASLYMHYPSKEALLLAFLQHRHETWFAGLHAATAKAKSPGKKVLAAFDYLQQKNVEEDFRGCAFLNMLSEVSDKEKEALAIIRSHKNELRSFFTQLLHEASPAVQTHVYLLFESAIVESQLYRDQWPVQEARKMVERLLGQK
ncbi:TetR/AcrR family transcriptional regulator [Chitinophaga lutea]|uniref:TetR/AcrR family transcriptional regulator n=1 Tax=Chitinophaga lutea TaxID=2488634 RepID=A0A3N4PVT9_9BACT|nr:TetR/AcrR family transcriptional regulator [Chitinophaga lutea]RPE12752.1 TetR/AcrR family transcriptional regulator [Chitinophaga lutea]